MSENSVRNHNSNRLSARGAIGLLMATAVLAGCSKQGEPFWDPDYGSGLDRCYEQPLERRTHTDGQALPDETPNSPIITINKMPSGEVPGDHGGLLPQVRTGIKSAVVRIYHDNSEAWANGFIAKAKNGEKVVVTAAHVGAVRDIGKLVISNNEGKRTGVLGGCFMSEHEGKFDKPRHDRASSVDVAVLKVPTSFTQKNNALTPSTNAAPERGEWGATTVAYPPGVARLTDYSMVSLGESADHQQHYLSGIQDRRDCSPQGTLKVSMCSGQHGESGSPIVDRRSGHVLGVLIGGINNEPQGFFDIEELRKHYGVMANISAGHNGDTWPTIVVATGSDPIAAALESPKATQPFTP